MCEKCDGIENAAENTRLGFNESRTFHESLLRSPRKIVSKHVIIR